MPGHVKIVALLGFMLVVVATPGQWYAVFGGYLAFLLVVVALSRVPPTYLLPRMVVEVPFVIFALLLPFVSRGPQTEFLGLTVSESGLLAAWTLLAKATLGVLAGLTLAATTEPQEVVRGLERLRLPNTMVQIMAFMIRYLEVVADDLRRQQIALASRGFSRPRSPALAGARPLRRGAVHPLLRARRTGPSGHAVRAATAGAADCRRS